MHFINTTASHTLARTVKSGTLLGLTAPASATPDGEKPGGVAEWGAAGRKVPVNPESRR